MDATPTTNTDDWTRLRKAAQNFGRWDVFENAALNYALEVDGPESPAEAEEAFRIVSTLVPKLLDAYAELWDMSIALTQAVEQWKSEGQGGKLLVADESEVREFGK